MDYRTMDPQNLGGVIFGASSSTFAECLERMRFGECFFFSLVRERIDPSPIAIHRRRGVEN